MTKSFDIVPALLIIGILAILGGMASACYNSHFSPEARADMEKKRLMEKQDAADLMRDGKVHVVTDLNGKKYAVKYFRYSDGEYCYTVTRVAE